MHRLVTRISRCIGDYEMISRGDRVLVGVSGGPDSVALIHVLCELASSLGIESAVAHFDHGMRPESAAHEIEWVELLAGRLGLHFYSGRLDTPVGRRGSLEAELRKARYRFLERTARNDGFSKIAVGHQADDNAEAVLMHLLRGSGIRGLSGIPPKRGRRIIRPLIRTHRAELEAYLRYIGAEWLVDPSNADMRFERNRIRHHLIPLLEREYNPRVVRVLNRTAALCFEEDRWADRLLEPTLEKIIVSSDADEMILAVAPLIRHDRPAQRRLLRQALRKWQGHLQRWQAPHIDQLITLLPSVHRTGHILHLPDRISVTRAADRLIFSRPAMPTFGRPTAPVPQRMPTYRYAIETPAAFPTTVTIEEADLRLVFTLRPADTLATVRADRRDTAFFDLARLAFPLVVRNPEEGDRIAPFGMAGTQKLKKLFIDRKIPRAKRWQTPVLTDGDAILWVVGVRRARSAAIDRHTNQVLCVSVEPIAALNRPRMDAEPHRRQTN